MGLPCVPRAILELGRTEGLPGGKQGILGAVPILSVSQSGKCPFLWASSSPACSSSPHPGETLVRKVGGGGEQLLGEAGELRRTQPGDASHGLCSSGTDQERQPGQIIQRSDRADLESEVAAAVGCRVSPCAIRRGWVTPESVTHSTMIAHICDREVFLKLSLGQCGDPTDRHFRSVLGLSRISPAIWTDGSPPMIALAWTPLRGPAGVGPCTPGTLCACPGAPMSTSTSTTLGEDSVVEEQEKSHPSGKIMFYSMDEQTLPCRIPTSLQPGLGARAGVAIRTSLKQTAEAQPDSTVASPGGQCPAPLHTQPCVCLSPPSHPGMELLPQTWLELAFKAHTSGTKPPTP